MPRGVMPQIQSNIDPSIAIPRAILQLEQNPHQLSDDTKAVLRRLRGLIKRAEQGKVHGLCFTAANNDRTYDVEVVGSYASFPTEAIGPVEILKHQLTTKALGKS